ncbi:MAG: sortase [bacterium]|nr:sortase [bacterium]
MSLAYWQKRQPAGHDKVKSLPLDSWLKKPKTSIKVRLASLIFLSAGAALALNALWPVLSYKLIWERRIAVGASTLVPMDQIQQAAGVIRPAMRSEANAIEVEKDESLNIANWFPNGMPKLPEKSYATNVYTISIPKLKIKDAKVIIGGEDLTKSLIHYKGTSVPGDLGQAVLFGHSNLPQFYSPNNYKTIFTRLPELEVGDRIQIKYDGVSYDFQIVTLRVVKPDDFSVLEQYYNYRGIRLITCVPPGTTWERLVVEARLIE